MMVSYWVETMAVMKVEALAVRWAVTRVVLTVDVMVDLTVDW
jgi:hypothetical protein